MTDFFTRLTERTLGTAPIAQPRITSLFAPLTPAMPQSPTLDLKVETFREGGTPAQVAPVLSAPPGSPTQGTSHEWLEPSTAVQPELSEIAAQTESHSSITPLVQSSPPSDSYRSEQQASIPLVPEVNSIDVASLKSSNAGVHSKVQRTQPKLVPINSHEQPSMTPPSELMSRPLIAPVLVNFTAQRNGESYRLSSESLLPNVAEQRTESPVSPPIIRVNIGRVEVRAVTTPSRSNTSLPTPPSPRLSLDDYLRNRSGGQ